MHLIKIKEEKNFYFFLSGFFYLLYDQNNDVPQLTKSVRNYPFLVFSQYLTGITERYISRRNQSKSRLIFLFRKDHIK
jgi:hypothetical protein